MNTYQSIDCLFTAWDLYNALHKTQQIVLDVAIAIHKKRGLTLNELSMYEFPNGRVFFDENHYMLYNQYNCIYLLFL